MIQTVQKYIESNKLLSIDDKIIVGVSGGADSVALIHILVSLGYSCIIAHCNFHLRGDNSNIDEEFTKELAEKLNATFIKEDFKTTQYAKEHHLSIEMAARELRYSWFEKMRLKFEAQAIAVAHHQDDSVETVLLNLTRGTGIRGLCGIQPKNGYVIRPLLAVCREEIERWLAEKKMCYRTDHTNLLDDYTRNYIRNQILPLLGQINPSVRKSIIRTANHLSDIELLYTDLIQKETKRIMDNDLRIDIQKLLESPAPQTILYEIIKPYGFNRELSASVFSSLNKESGKKFYASESNYKILKDRDYLLLSTFEKKNIQEFKLYEDGALIQPIRLELEKIIKTNEFQIEKSRFIAQLDYEKIAFPLIIRTWRDGDWFVPLGMKGRKKLSDFFNDQKYSRNQKDQTWLLCNGSDIIWIIGDRIDNRFKIDSTTKNILQITFFP